MAMLLAEILYRTSLTREGREGHYVEIPRAILQSVGGTHYARILKECEPLGYIKINPPYSTEYHFCKSYRIKKKYRTGETDEYALNRARPGANDRIRIDPSNETDQRLVGYMREAVIPGNVAAEAWANYAVQAIQRGELYATRCDYGRFHSTFTALPKNVRSQILLSGSKTTETDVSNAQAICLGLLTANHTETQPDHRHNRPTLYHMCISARGENLKVKKVPSVQKYIEYCEAGEMYELLLDRAIAQGYRLYDFIYDPRGRHKYDKITKQSIPNRDLTRDDVKGEDVKGEFVRMIFCESWKTVKMPLYPIFAGEFSAIAEYMLLAKSPAYTGLPSKIAYKELARNCQHLESNIMIDHVARYLSLRFPIITIHDSIISPEAYDREVAAEIKRWWGEAGITVSVKKT